VEALFLQTQEEVLEVGVQLCVEVEILKVAFNQEEDNRAQAHRRQGAHKAHLQEIAAADSTAVVPADHNDKMTLERME
jgi:hypothetical protein